MRVLDEPTYLRPILQKLPEDLQGRWQRHAYRYKLAHDVNYPPFHEFSQFIQNVAMEKNDPYLKLVQPPQTHENRKPAKRVSAAKTEVSKPNNERKNADPKDTDP